MLLLSSLWALVSLPEGSAQVEPAWYTCPTRCEHWLWQASHLVRQLR